MPGSSPFRAAAIIVPELINNDPSVLYSSSYSAGPVALPTRSKLTVMPEAPSEEHANCQKSPTFQLLAPKEWSERLPVGQE